MSQASTGDQTRNDEEFFNLLRNQLLRSISEDDYVPNGCLNPEHNESEIVASLTGPSREYYECATSRNDDSCQYYIANAFLKGKYQFPQDKALAFKYMKKAASQGNRYALYGLSYLMLRNNTEEEEEDNGSARKYIEMLKIATFFNSNEAAYVLGFIYAIGFHVERNYVISLIYLKFAADNNYSPAMLMFADRLRNIANNRIPRNEIQQMKTECIDFLNDNTGINEINRKLEETAISVYNIIEDQQLADK